MMQTPIPNGAFTRTNGASGTDRVHAIFKRLPVLDPVATEAQGRQIYQDHEFVEMIFPGDPTKKPVFKVNDEHRQRWSEEYKAFKAGLDIAVNGTPIEMWPVLAPSQIMELKYLGFKTVEDLAGMNDLATQKMMGGMRIRELARGFLDDGAASAFAAKLASDNDKKDAQIAALTRQVEELGATMSKLHGDLQAKLNEPNPLLTTIPGMNDPVEQARMVAAAQGVHVPTAQLAESSLANLPAPRKRGKKKTDAA